MMSDTQMALPLRRAGAPQYSLDELAREARLCHSFGAAVVRCGTLAGFDLDKESAPAGMDKARWSRIGSGREGILWPQLEGVMTECGNDLPLVWIAMHRGWDPTTMRRQETVLETQLRLVQEELARERLQRQHAEAFVAGIMKAAAKVPA